MGTIRFDRKSGTEIWKITSSEFSISNHMDKYKINIWVESHYELIEKLETTGDTPTTIELVFPINDMPNFKEKFYFKMPKLEEVRDNWDEDKDYYCNWYYYEHRDIENLEVEIHEISKGIFKIQITGIVEDPTDSNTEMDTKLTIEFESSLNSELKGYWAY